MLTLPATVVWIECLLVMSAGFTATALQEKLDKCQNPTKDTSRNWNDIFRLAQQVKFLQDNWGKCQNLTAEILKNRNNETHLIWQVVKISDKLINAIVQKDSAVLLNVLLDDGLDVNTITTFLEDKTRSYTLNLTIISQAAFINASNIVELLVNRKADLELSAADYKKTPLAYAAQQGNPRTVELLVKHGANVNATTAIGSNALTFAALHQSLKTMHALIVSGIYIDAKDTAGQTALMHAAKKGKPCSVKCLLEFGADKLLTDKENKTAAQIVPANKYPEIIECLSDRCDNLQKCKCV